MDDKRTEEVNKLKLEHEDDLLELLRSMCHSMREREQVMFGRLQILESKQPAFFNGSPMWFKVLCTLGLPTFLVLVGIGMFTGFIPSPVAETKNLVEAHATESGLLKQQMTAQTRLLRIICQNTSPDQNAARECIQ